MRTLYTSQGNGPRLPRRVAALAAAAGTAVLLVASCSSGSSSGPATPTNAAGATLSEAPNPSSFSGEPPSAFASALESASASVAARSASAAAAASAFEASADAQAAQNRAKATEVLKTVEGPGNATADITLTGVPRSTTGGLHAAVVTIVNSTREAASYAVQVDFTDASGHAVDSAIVGAENLAPGGKASPIAFSRQPADLALVPVVVKAQRY
ncbi:hypothetical protein ACFWNL_37025 [Kitasatospora sp. NPDC058397]|uniref:hypothetical protein n=1 Tax=unclassified Kitasatospora TaxID=2633591 RepID=UPI003648917F